MSETCRLVIAPSSVSSRKATLLAPETQSTGLSGNGNSVRIWRVHGAKDSWRWVSF
jgi:hypothetical protein